MWNITIMRSGVRRKVISFEEGEGRKEEGDPQLNGSWAIRSNGELPYGTNSSFSFRFWYVWHGMYLCEMRNSLDNAGHFRMYDFWTKELFRLKFRSNGCITEPFDFVRRSLWIIRNIFVCTPGERNDFSVQLPFGTDQSFSKDICSVLPVEQSFNMEQSRMCYAIYSLHSVLYW